MPIGLGTDVHIQRPSGWPVFHQRAEQVRLAYQKTIRGPRDAVQARLPCGNRGMVI